MSNNLVPNIPYFMRYLEQTGIIYPFFPATTLILFVINLLDLSMFQLRKLANPELIGGHLSCIIIIWFNFPVGIHFSKFFQKPCFQPHYVPSQTQETYTSHTFTLQSIIVISIETIGLFINVFLILLRF